MGEGTTYGGLLFPETVYHVPDVGGNYIVNIL